MGNRNIIKSTYVVTCICKTSLVLLVHLREAFTLLITTDKVGYHFQKQLNPLIILLLLTKVIETSRKIIL